MLGMSMALDLVLDQAYVTMKMLRRELLLLQREEEANANVGRDPEPTVPEHR